jgi:hypothetical protein
MVEQSRGPYEVIFLWIAERQVVESAARAVSPEVKNSFLGAVRAIVARLEADPTSWGERKFRYKYAGLDAYERLQDRIVTHYAVDEIHRVVYVTECRPALDHPLATP